MFTKYVTTSATAIVCAGALAFAQAPAAGTDHEQRTDQTRAAGEQQITLTGCLQRAGEVPAAERAALGTEPFVLTDATPHPIAQQYQQQEQQPAAQDQAAAQPDRADRDAVGTTGVDRTMRADGMTYRIEGLDEQKLEQHEGQRVEVTGTIDRTAYERRDVAPTSGATDPTAPEPGATQPGAAHDTSIGGAGQIPTLQAESIRVVAGECPGDAGIR